MMLYYISLPIFSVFMIVLQSIITDIIFSNCFVFEVSLVVVIYAGFHLDIIKGTVLAFCLGFVLDCVGGSVLGLLALFYMIIFWSSFFISDLLDTEKKHVIVFFSFLCIFLKEIIINSIYYLLFGIKMLPNAYFIIFMQALVIGLVAPLIFFLMDRTGISAYEKKV